MAMMDFIRVMNISEFIKLCHIHKLFYNICSLCDGADDVLGGYNQYAGAARVRALGKIEWVVLMRDGWLSRFLYCFYCYDKGAAVKVLHLIWRMCHSALCTLTISTRPHKKKARKEK